MIKCRKTKCANHNKECDNYCEVLNQVIIGECFAMMDSIRKIRNLAICYINAYSMDKRTTYRKFKKLLKDEIKKFEWIDEEKAEEIVAYIKNKFKFASDITTKDIESILKRYQNL